MLIVEILTYMVRRRIQKNGKMANTDGFYSLKLGPGRPASDQNAVVSGGYADQKGLLGLAR